MTMAALEDARSLFPWIESNSLVLNDPDVEAKMLATLDAQLPGTPVLQYPNPDVPAVPLVELRIAGVSHRVTHCDRCEQKLPAGCPSYSLLVPMGGAVVLFTTCPLCHHVLDDCYSPLVWGLEPTEDHVERAADAGWGRLG
jgi:hypothetical protein